MSAQSGEHATCASVMQMLDGTRLSMSDSEKVATIVETTRVTLIDAKQRLAESSVQVVANVGEYDFWNNAEILLLIALDYVEGLGARLASMEVAGMSANALLVGQGA